MSGGESFPASAGDFQPPVGWLSRAAPGRALGQGWKPGEQVGERLELPLVGGTVHPFPSQCLDYVPQTYYVSLGLGVLDRQDCSLLHSGFLLLAQGFCTPLRGDVFVPPTLNSAHGMLGHLRSFIFIRDTAHGSKLLGLLAQLGLHVYLHSLEKVLSVVLRHLS